MSLWEERREQRRRLVAARAAVDEAESALVHEVRLQLADGRYVRQVAGDLGVGAATVDRWKREGLPSRWRRRPPLPL